MNAVAIVGLGSLKALLMLLVAAGIALTLRRGPARLRAVIWGTALVGSLLIPLAASVVPELPVVVPMVIPQLASEPPVPAPVAAVHGGLEETTSVPSPRESPPLREPSGRRWSAPSVDDVALSIWASVAIILFGFQLVSLRRMVGLVRRARPVTDSAVLELADDVRAEIGCRRRIRVVTSPELDIPAVFGFIRPVVVLPIHSRTWLEDRLTAVLQHELIHVIRLDWPVRVAARLACAVYWFNPLVWWAKRRLDLEQETACDEEVLSLGSRASAYACHLLGIARTAAHRPVLAVAGLEMARRSHLEERIMRILNRSNHRRVGLSVILPVALLTAALVPAIAAVQPTEPGPRKASPELKTVMAEMEDAQKQVQPYLDRIKEHEFNLQPQLERIQAMEVAIDDEAIAQIEAEMQPILEQIEALHVDMEPMHDQIEAMHESIASVRLHVEDGTLAEIQEQIHAQIQAHQAELESVHIDMEPIQRQLEALHAQLEPLQKQIERIHLEAIPSQQEMERFQEAMVPFEEEMERLQEGLEPFEEAMERLGERLHVALQDEVAEVLRSHLGPVTGPDAPFAEAAARIVDDANIHVNDGVLELDASRRETREILNDLFVPVRIGTQDAFDGALEAAVDEISDLEFETD